MKKTIVFSFIFFVVGIGLTGLVLINPLNWNWAQAVGGRLAPMATSDQTNDPTGTGERRVRYWVAPMDPTYISDEPGKSPMGMDLVPVYEEAEQEHTVAYWAAPMDPNYTSDQPGKSPMGMDLVPVYTDEVGDTPGMVRIDPVFVQNIGVRSVEVARADIPHTIRTVGNFVYDDNQIALVNTKYEGWIENVEVNYIGERVQRGQRLFDIFSPQLVNAQQEYLDAVAYLERLRGSDYPEIIERARSLVASSGQRLRYWDITDDQISELEQSGAPRRTLTVFSPVDGLVVSKMDQALEGMLAQPGMNLYKIADLSTIWIEAEVFEDAVPWLRVGQSATIEIPNLPGRRYTGTVRYIYPFFNPDTRTLKLSIELPNPTEELRADMYADVRFDVPSARGVIAIPEEAVIRSGERNVIVLDLGNGTFQVREVDLGMNGNGLWEIREGLAEGSRVVVSSQFLIDSESNLREAIRKLIAEDPPSPSPEMDMPDQD
jgi:Cu(I)/Ag(I) efflux system membrane fusion protein